MIFPTHLLIYIYLILYQQWFKALYKMLPAVKHYELEAAKKDKVKVK